MSVRDLANWGLHETGLAGLSRKILVRNGRFALNFHGVSSRRYRDVPRSLQPHHSIPEFRQVLEWLSINFTFLKVNEFLAGDKTGILLTFDDGHANNLLNILPILTEFRAPGLFFISTQHVRNPQDWLPFIRQNAVCRWGCESKVPADFAHDCCDGLSDAQVVELSQSPWAVIGSHTITHPSLVECSDEQLNAELVESRLYLEKISGQPVDYLAYPFGRYDRRVAEASRIAGYSVAFAVDPLPIGLPVFEVPRVGIYDSSPSYLNVKLSGLHRRALHSPILV